MSNNSENRNLHFKQNNFSVSYNQDASCMILTWKSDAAKAFGAKGSVETKITRVQYWVTDDLSNLRQGEAKGIAADLAQLDKVADLSVFMPSANEMSDEPKQDVFTPMLDDFLRLNKYLN